MMRQVLLGFGFAFALLAFPLRTAAQPEPGQTFNVKVTDVTDGDTFDARRSDGQTITVRLFGVDAPESDQPGQKATAAVKRYIGGKNVRLIVEDTDRYGRTIGTVEVERGTWRRCWYGRDMPGTTSGTL